MAAVLIAFITAASAIAASDAPIVETRPIPSLCDLVAGGDRLWLLNRWTRTVLPFETTSTGNQPVRGGLWMIAAGFSNDFWFSAEDSALPPFSSLAHLSSTGAVTVLPQYVPIVLARGTDGIWFTAFGNTIHSPRYIGFIDPNGTITTFVSAYDTAFGIAPAADGGAWISLGSGAQLYHVTRGGVFTSKPMPISILLGRFHMVGDGTFWLAGARGCVRFDAAGNVIDWYDHVDSSGETQYIADTDGALWASGFGSIFRIKNHAETSFNPGVPLACGTIPLQIHPRAFDADGYLWATTFGGGVSYGSCEVPQAYAYRIDTAKLFGRKRSVRH